MQLLPKQAPNKIGLIGHTIIHYPTPEVSMAIIDILVENKVALIELQIPFSEPIADGPLFTKANHEAIQNGVTLEDCYQFMSQVNQKYHIPVVFMTYANVVIKQGYETFIKKSKAMGAVGAIIPDLPLDLAKDYLAVCRQYNFVSIPIVSPNISDLRLSEISPLFDGFIYAVARAGVTGSKTKFDDTLTSYLEKLRAYSNLPIAVGFGISSSNEINILKGKADYAVVGSETLRVYQQEGLAGVRKLWQEFAVAINGS
jgi:tryptophan synthase alpha chain